MKHFVIICDANELFLLTAAHYIVTSTVGHHTTKTE